MNKKEEYGNREKIDEINLLNEITSNTNIICEKENKWNKLNIETLIDLLNSLEIIRINRDVTLPANAYCKPYSYYSSIAAFNKNEVEGFIGIVNTELVNPAGVTQGVHVNQMSFDTYDSGDIYFSISSTEATNALRIWCLRIKPKS